MAANKWVVVNLSEDNAPWDVNPDFFLFQRLTVMTPLTGEELWEIDNKKYSKVTQYRSATRAGPFNFIQQHAPDKIEAVMHYIRDLVNANEYRFKNRKEEQEAAIRSALVPVGKVLERLCFEHGVSKADRDVYWGLLGTFYPDESLSAEAMRGKYLEMVKGDEDWEFEV